MADSGTVDVVLTVFEPLELACGDGLRFGLVALVDTSSSGEITIPGSLPLGSITTVNAVALSPPPIRGAASCAVTGTLDATYDIGLPTSILLSNGGADMTVDNFESFPISGDLDIPFGALGSDTFGIGARLNINANQMPGFYNGTFMVTVDYTP